MKKIWLTLMAAVMIFSVALGANQGQAAAAASQISIYIDGQKLYSPQAPIMVKGRAMLPMRAIFEALDATLDWNAKTKTVTAKRDQTTIVLKIGSTSAIVNNRTLSLDVPGQIYKGSTMVPVRFVSEALGEKVDWNASNKTVTITTSGGPVNAVAYVSARVVSKNGDGRDVEVSFPKVSPESGVSEYRVLMIKSGNAYNFNLAQALSTSSYTSIRPDGDDVSITLSSQTRDVNGDLLRSGQSYAAFVLTVGKRGNSALSGVSQTITLSQAPTLPSVGAVSNLKVSDASDYGDGRDLSVSFTKAQTENNITNYRIYVVKTKDKNSFDLAAANKVSSSNFTVVNKAGTTLSGNLSSSARDTSGELIRNGVPYTVFVMSVNTGSYTSQLSAASSSITLAANAVSAPVITRVDDISNYGDGRDLRVNFNKVSDESRIGSYRIFVVKDSKAGSFSLSAANNVPSAYYTQVGKTGYNISQALSSGARDVDGSLIANGVVYRVFVMAVGTGSYSGSNALSSASSSIVLYGNGNVDAASNVNVSDISDYGDGRDLRVTFNRASDESRISGYRIMVVKSNQAGSFNLSWANSVSSSNYTTVDKTGYNITKVLSSGARDVDGDYIRNGTSYRVFVLSIGSGGYSGSNALSSYSPAITLGTIGYVGPASNVSVSDVSDYGDGRDLLVNFKRADDERYISQYRILVVKSGDAGSFNLNDANAVRSSNYTAVAPNGANISKALASGARDVDGDAIRNGISYRVFILSVGTGSYAGTNALSSYSPSITLSGNVKVDPATNVKAADIGDNGDASDLQVTFNRAKDESNIKGYRILVVEAGSARFFGLSDAEKVSSSAYTPVDKTGSDLSGELKSGARDVDNNAIKNDVSYKVFVLSVGANGTNALSEPSAPITLTTKAASPVTDVSVSDVGDNNNGSDLEVSFTKAADESDVYGYRVLVVPADKADGLKAEAAAEIRNYTEALKGNNFKQKLSPDARDIDDKLIENGKSYKVLVLSMMTTSGKGSVLSKPSNEIKLQSNPTLVTRVTASELKDEEVKVTFAKATDESTIDYYKVFAVPVGSTTFMTAKSAKEVPDSFKKVDKGNKGSYETAFQAGDKDIYGQELDKNASYLVYVLSVLKGDQASKSVLSSETGFMFVTAFDEKDTKGYAKNQLVSDQGSIYQVLKDSPQGTPGNSGDYKLLKKAEAKATVSSKTKG
ncbi:copper amine oxidase N-terminal domain-containing protein [Paenibacillus favisporus]|uniref:copper amine oxidase N-terminal domain-containing protein n=1 Tax=Paenibacillus favisporus TaxID=221028 RepID=UPI002DBCEB3C|nr:copper amine oxidase N-terminal domain-containing protein [Paenibacillus favisporus]MEC0175463.1 copper amine oxidase N-terminal domain-containing protein [Paenibacillus favisporus]